MVDRLKIFQTMVGSRLYGTNLPTSDVDFKGVYLPSSDDLLGLQACPGEFSESVKLSDGDKNTVGDIDNKFYSLQKFLTHAANGQPWALEMLYAPAPTIVTPQWEKILTEAKSLIVSKKGIAGFVGFALAQSYKASIKGENLNKIRAMLRDAPQYGNLTVLEYLEASITARNSLDRVKAEDGTPVVEIAGRKFNYGLKIKVFIESLLHMEQRYGTRSDNAASDGQDWKSLYHAYRLISEAKEFLETGNITLPRPDAAHLMDIRLGKYEADYQVELTRKIDEIRQVIEPKSPLPEGPNWSKINKFCLEMLRAHIVTGA